MMLRKKTRMDQVREMVPAVPKSLKGRALLATAQGALTWAALRLGLRKRRPPYGKIAAGGLAAAAVAVPVGMMVGRKLRGANEAAPVGAPVTAAAAD
jgi:hypothetical protein